ncbi:MAG TPA: hypothetical protein VHC00_00480 [Rhizobiaceae bacterium]|nr:hypothetical protein [Rhizobiaceae bacterium]
MSAITLETTPQEHAAIASFFREGRNGGFTWLLYELRQSSSERAAPWAFLRFGNPNVAESDEAWAFRASIDVALLAAVLGTTLPEIDEHPRPFAKAVAKYAADMGRPIEAGRVAAVLRDGRWGSAGAWVSPEAVGDMRKALRATPVWAVLQELQLRERQFLGALHTFAYDLRGAG